MEIHRAPGPPRTNIVMSDGRRIAVLEVDGTRERGAVHHADRTRWSLHRPPGASEWWIVDDLDQPLGTLARTNLVRERFTLEIAGAEVRIVPLSSPWQRRWSVVDRADHQIIEVIQRPLSRTVHDLLLRSGDVPAELPLAVAWTVALATSTRVTAPRRTRWSLP